MKQTILILILTIIIDFYSFSEIIEAASCSGEDVQAAINSASDGDTVLIPAGNCTWAEALVIDPMPAITIQGSGIDNTIIIDSTGSGWMQCPLWIVGVESKPFRITGISFKGTTSTYGAVCINGTCKDFRIDHCEFDSLVGRGIVTRGYTYGVIDNCIFRECRHGVAPGADAASSWSRPLTLGTSNAVYIEDCVFDNSAFDAYSGARYVFRHNTIINRTPGHHGTCSGDRGTFSFEFYNNHLNTGPGLFCAFHLRSGTGVIFNNTMTGYEEGIYVTNYRSCDGSGSDCSTIMNYGRCDGTNPLDGNMPGMMGYPCLDQIGRATNQLLEPLYEWNNTLNDENADIIPRSGWPECNDPSPLDHILENRDFYNDTPRPGYEPYTYPHPLTQEWPPPAQTDVIAPTVPQNFSVELTEENEVKLTWDACTDLGGSGMAGYYIWLNGERVTSNSDSTYTSYIMKGLFAGQTDTFEVSAFDNAGNESAPSTEISMEIPPTPISYSIINSNNFYIYPNPFTYTATIEYTLPESSDVEITLYDLTGKIIKHLYSGHQSQGIHTLNINTGGLGKGVYFCRIKTELYDLTRKCIISE